MSGGGNFGESGVHAMNGGKTGGGESRTKIRGKMTFRASLRLALLGIAAAFREESHMRFHGAAAVVVVAAGWWLNVGRAEWLWLLAAIFLVLIAELINTAVERTVDFASPERHPLAKAAKDTAAGAVLMAALFAVIVGLIVLGPPLWDKIS